MTLNIFNKIKDARKGVYLTLIKKYFLPLLAILTIFIFYWTFASQMDSYSKKKEKNLNFVLNSVETLNLKKYFVDKINSTYFNEKYIIRNNDNIDKILNRFNVNNEEIKLIVSKLKSKKLTNIYVGREFNIITKKTDKDKNSVVSILFPISNKS